MLGKLEKGIAGERGYVLVGALLILLLLVVIGIAATTSTTLELQIAGSQRVRGLSFYAAESGKSFGWASPEISGSMNVVVGVPLPFPTPQQLTKDSDVGKLGANADQSFTGVATYIESGPLPRGSGFSEGYVAHFYTIESTGRGPNSAEATVQVKLYKVRL